VLLYLNGVGDTWFPLALPEEPETPTSAGGHEKRPANPSRQAALSIARKLAPERDGMRVAPRKGDAVAFYNYLDDGSTTLDRLALHAGLPAPAEKSIATLWYQVDLAADESLGRRLTVAVGPQTRSYRAPPDGSG